MAFFIAYMTVVALIVYASLWRIGALLTGWMPVTGHVLAHDYGEGEVMFDDAMRWVDPVPAPLLRRGTWLKLRYDIGDVERVADVRCFLPVGRRVDPALTLWVRRDDPEHVTMRGLRFWIAVAAAAALAGAAGVKREALWAGAKAEFCAIQPGGRSVRALVVTGLKQRCPRGDRSAVEEG